MSDTEEVIDLHSMKVTELKQELKSRGLPVSGAKAELIERLENYMQEHEGVEVVEEEEEQVEEASSAEKSSAEKEESSGANDISIAADESQDEIKDSGEKPKEASPVAVEKEKSEPVQVNAKEAQNLSPI